MPTIVAACASILCAKARSYSGPKLSIAPTVPVGINLVLNWTHEHCEPWYLATSLADPRHAVPMYRRRMQSEQYFKDADSVSG